MSGPNLELLRNVCAATDPDGNVVELTQPAAAVALHDPAAEPAGHGVRGVADPDAGPLGDVDVELDRAVAEQPQDRA